MTLDELLALVAPARSPEEAVIRAQQPSLLTLLEQERNAKWLTLYASSFDKGGTMMLHSVLVPVADLAEIDGEDLTHWSGNPYDSWGCGLVWGGGESARVEFSEPPSRLGSRNLLHAQQLVFGRSFDGRGEDKRYFEIAQFLTHAHGLHWVPERHAWSLFDDNGDIEDVIVWHEEEGRGGYATAVCISIKREVVEMQMSATSMVLVQMFDSTVIPSEFPSWGGEAEQTAVDSEHGLYYRYRIEGPGSYFRGVQLIEPARTAQEYGVHLERLQKQPKQFESFITVDWKNKRQAIVSCAPEAIASYFEKDSPLPFQISPVFFNAAVLEKYKSDPEKYSLEHRSITCRNSWHLQTYDVNDAGQIHTYLKYLGDLPHSEQRYWKAFNEAPRAPISRRAFTTDFEGNFDTQPDSLRDLQGLVAELDVADLRWYTLREPELTKQLHYPLTSSTKGWGDVLSALGRVVNEGLERKFFEKTAKEHGAEGDPKWGSILWAKEALKAKGVDESVILEAIQPLLDLQTARTKLTGAHSGGDEARRLKASLLREHKSPRAHVEHLCERLVHSLQMLKETFK